MPPAERVGWRAAFVALLVIGLAPLAKAESRSALALQGGWWNVEAEWKTPAGVYLAVGAPWAAFLLGGRGVVPFGARVGYQLEASPVWKLRGALHVAGRNERASCGCGARETRTFAFVELGARYEAPSGFVAGLDLPLFAFDQAHDVGRGQTAGVELFPPPLSFAFAQLYLGYAWRF